MARLWNKDLLLSANTDAFNQRLNEMRYNAASENRKQWANAIGNMANSLGEIGKAAYEDYQRDQRYKSIDDADAEYKNDPVWIAAKNEYAKTGDSSKLNAVKTQFVAQQQAEAAKAQVEEERKRRLEGVKASLAGLKQQIEAPDIKTGDRLALITQYDTKAAEAGLPAYSKDVPKPQVPVELPKPAAPAAEDSAEPEHLTDSGIENAINSRIDQNGDGKFDSVDIQMLIDAVNNDKTRDEEADKKGILAKLRAEKEKLVKEEEISASNDAKKAVTDFETRFMDKTGKVKPYSYSKSELDLAKEVVSKMPAGNEKNDLQKTIAAYELTAMENKQSYDPSKDLKNLGDKKARERLKKAGYEVKIVNGEWKATK